MTREEEWYVSFYHWWNHYIALPHIFSLVCHSKHWKLTKALYKIKPTSEYYYYTLIYSKLTWKIKLIFTLLIRCKFMCCSQHFTTYLLSLQNILFFDWRRTSYIILSIYMLDWNSLVYASPPNDISRLSFWKTERLPRLHIPIDFIKENAIFLRIHVIVRL